MASRTTEPAGQPGTSGADQGNDNAKTNAQKDANTVQGEGNATTPLLSVTPTKKQRSDRVDDRQLDVTNPPSPPYYDAADSSPKTTVSRTFTFEGTNLFQGSANRKRKAPTESPTNRDSYTSNKLAITNCLPVAITPSDKVIDIKRKLFISIKMDKDKILPGFEEILSTPSVDGRTVQTYVEEKALEGVHRGVPLIWNPVPHKEIRQLLLVRTALSDKMKTLMDKAYEVNFDNCEVAIRTAAIAFALDFPSLFKVRGQTRAITQPNHLPALLE